MLWTNCIHVAKRKSSFLTSLLAGVLCKYPAFTKSRDILLASCKGKKCLSLYHSFSMIHSYKGGRFVNNIIPIIPVSNEAKIGF